MRLDLYLKASRLAIRRSVARKLCDAGLVSVNGQIAKPSKEVSAGDVVDIIRGRRRLVVKVAATPGSKQVSRHDAALLYAIISDDALPDEIPY